MIIGAIVAGGIGTRLNIGKLPKQFMNLGQKPIIIHTLEKFILCERIDYIYVGVHKDWTLYAEDLFEKYGVDKSRVFVTQGGEDRNETIMNIINAAQAKFGENENDVIVTHDAVRPFVTMRIIQENIDAALKYGACDTAVPAIDTIVESKDGIMIENIPQRKELYQGQTPQSFNMSKLKSIYQNLNEKEKNILTDACKIFVFGKEPVYIVKGETSNIKITTVGDYKIAQAMVNEQNLSLF